MAERLVLLVFDEMQLTQELRDLAPVGRIAFSAACAERQRPNLSRSTANGSGDVTASFAAAIDAVWQHLLGTPLHDAEVADLIRRCERVMRNEDSEEGWREEVMYAENAGAAVIYTLKCVQTEDPQMAVWAARQSIEALDSYLWERLTADFDDEPSEEMVLAHPLLQAEVRRQRDDLTTARHIDRESRTPIVLTLRTRAREAAMTFFDA